MGSLGLLLKRRFAPLFATLFAGAFNDNVFKNALALLLVYGVAQRQGLDAAIWVPVAHGLFILPYLLFSATAGQLADKLEKSLLIRVTKLFEIAVMTLAAGGFMAGSLVLLMSAVFLMGLQSALFSPVKYGILPDVVSKKELLSANALVELGTFLAILLGTILGGVLIGLGHHGALYVTVVVLLVALLGWLFSTAVAKVDAAEPTLKLDANIARQSIACCRFAAKDRAVFWAILGISWFWFYGATMLATLPTYARDVLAVDSDVVTLFFALFCLGVGIGSFAVAFFARFDIENGLVPIAMLGLALSTLDFFLTGQRAAGALLTPTGPAAFLARPQAWHLLLDLFLISLFCGLFTVPLQTLIQKQADPKKRSRILAANSIFNALFMVLSAGIVVGFGAASLSSRYIFLLLAMLGFVAALIAGQKALVSLSRTTVWFLLRALYRFRITGLDRVPSEGPLLMVANHVTYIDALFIAASVRREVRFVMHYKYARLPLISSLVERGIIIPIAQAKEDAELLRKARDEISRGLKNGDAICIFPEGRLTRDGEVDTFRPGVEQILEQDPVPVLPLALRGLWGSIFSYDKRRTLGVLPKRFRSRIELCVGKLRQAHESSAACLQQVVTELRGLER